MGFAEGVGVGFDGELRLAAMFRASWHAGSPFASCFIAAGKVESELVFFKPCCNKTNTWHLEFLYFSELTLKKKKKALTVRLLLPANPPKWCSGSHVFLVTSQVVLHLPASFTVRFYCQDWSAYSVLVGFGYNCSYMERRMERD